MPNLNPIAIVKKIPKISRIGHLLILNILSPCLVINTFSQSCDPEILERILLIPPTQEKLTHLCASTEPGNYSAFDGNNNKLMLTFVPLIAEDLLNLTGVEVDNNFDTYHDCVKHWIETYYTELGDSNTKCHAGLMYRGNAIFGFISNVFKSGTNRLMTELKLNPEVLSIPVNIVVMDDKNNNDPLSAKMTLVDFVNYCIIFYGSIYQRLDNTGEYDLSKVPPQTIWDFVSMRQQLLDYGISANPITEGPNGSQVPEKMVQVIETIIGNFEDPTDIPGLDY